MANYLIGIGGTGAKCVEAVLHMCAAGLGPDDLHVIFVDPDRANGMLDRADQTLSTYAKCRGLEFGNTPLFRTRVTSASPARWSPFQEHARPTLEDFVSYPYLVARDEAAASLADTLFSRAELETSLERGFRGHPSIGATVLAGTVRLGDVEPWRSFRNALATDLKSGAPTSVVVVGSVFGGTGAAGLPTIGRLIRDEMTSIGMAEGRLAAILMLPYFSFTPDAQASLLRASAENFLVSTQAALQYYYQQRYFDIYSDLYLLGDSALSPVGNYSEGATDQRNAPHFIELLAAQAAIHAWSGGKLRGVWMTSRGAENRVGWEDIPGSEGPSGAKTRIEHLARFATAFLADYYPMLEHIRESGKSYLAPWYVDLLVRSGSSVSDPATYERLQDLKRYCESFLQWCEASHGSAPGTVVELLNTGAFKALKIDRGECASLAFPVEAVRSRPSARLWTRMCRSKVTDKRTAGVGRFARALFDAASPTYDRQTTQN